MGGSGTQGQQGASANMPFLSGGKQGFIFQLFMTLNFEITNANSQRSLRVLMNWKLKSQQNLLETESRTVVARCWGMGEKGNGCSMDIAQQCAYS